MSGTFDKAKGAAEEALGDIKQNLGDALDDRSLQAEGVKDKVKGKAHRAQGEVKDQFDRKDR